MKKERWWLVVFPSGAKAVAIIVIAGNSLLQVDDIHLFVLVFPRPPFQIVVVASS